MGGRGSGGASVAGGSARGGSKDGTILGGKPREIESYYREARGLARPTTRTKSLKQELTETEI